MHMANFGWQHIVPSPKAAKTRESACAGERIALPGV
jgi:hypothetical protein